MEKLMNYCVSEVRRKSFWVNALAAGVIVYLIVSLVRGEWQGPFLAMWWFISGAIGIAGSTALWNRYIDHKEAAFNAALAEPPGYTCTAYTVDGATIGDIPEPVYLEARYHYDIDVMSRVAQVLNGVWVVWSVIVRAVMTIPVALVIAAFAAPHIADPSTLSQLTIGQILAEPGFLLLGQAYAVVVIATVVFASFSRGPSALPGYRDHRGAFFKRLLSARFPQVATADGFSVCVYKIEPGTGEIEVPAH